MTATFSNTFSKTLYAPNPPQLDDPWLKLVLGLVLVLGIVGTAFCLGT